MQRLLVSVVVAASVASGCGVSAEKLDRAAGDRPARTDTGSSGTTESAGGPPTTDPQIDRSGTDVGGDRDVELPQPDPLRWGPCEQFRRASGLRCAELDVPLDYGDPSKGDITLGMVRNQADGPGRPIGSVLVNPGGPGGSAVDFAAGVTLPAEITERFDVVGVDPRGVGASSPLSCHENVAELYDVDPSPDDSAERDALIDVSLEYIEACEAEYADILPHLGTRNVARDMEMVRRALGDDGLTYIGLSYGTSIGQQYAELFPDQVRAMVLDGVVDPAADGLEAAATQAEGFENTFQAFLDQCADQPDCLLGDDPEATVRSVMDAAEAAPIPSERADRPATPGTVALGMISGLYNESRWPALEAAIADAADGDGTGLVNLADDYLSREPDGDYPDGTEIYFAVSCLDSAWPTDPDDVLDAARQADDRAPHFGQATVSDYIRCSLWPTEPQPLEPVTAEGTPPIMVISTTNDPATPYENGVAVAERLSNAFLLTVEGNNHVAFLGANDCVDSAVIDYIVDLETLPDGSEC